MRLVRLTLAMSAASMACDIGPETADILVSGGTVLDGSGGPSVYANVAVQEGRIIHVGPGGPSAVDTIDATGLTVAPGFIDVHSHTPPALADPEVRLNEGVIRQGVTTVIGGPDGGASPGDIAGLVDILLEQGIGTNVAFYVGHNAIRREVLGDDQQHVPSIEELAEMRALVREGMEMGALGFSTGLMYEPGMFSETSEVTALAAEAAPFGGVYDSHVRNPVQDFVASDVEVVEIAEGAGVSGKIGHLKAVGLHNEGVIEEIIALVEAARARGVEIVSDQYPYDGAATSGLSGIVVVPPGMEGLDQFAAMGRQTWSEEGIAQLKAALDSPDRRPALKEASENGVDGGFAWLKATGYTSMRIVSSVDYPELVGEYLSEVASARGVEPFDAVSDLIIGAAAPVNVTLGAIKEHDVRRLLIQPWNMIASDGEAADGSESPFGHPRSAGTFPRLLGHYVREEGVLTLEEAVRKITSLPAAFHGLADRGYLEVGAIADVAIFDADMIIDRSDWDHPNRFAVGVTHVLVNGVPVLADGEMTGAAPGQVVRGNSR